MLRGGFLHWEVDSVPNPVCVAGGIEGVFIAGVERMANRSKSVEARPQKTTLHVEEVTSQKSVRSAKNSNIATETGKNCETVRD